MRMMSEEMQWGRLLGMHSCESMRREFSQHNLGWTGMWSGQAAPSDLQAWFDDDALGRSSQLIHHGGMREKMPIVSEASFSFSISLLDHHNFQRRNYVKKIS